MQTLDGFEPQALVTIDVSTWLNLACFVRDAAGLSAASGYHVGLDYHWPYREARFEESTTAEIFLQASYQWPLWWMRLVEARYEMVNGGVSAEEPTDYQSVSVSLEGFPELRQAVSCVWSSFWGWWLLPYVGGKMALASVDVPQDLYTKIQTVAPGRWHWDLIYRHHIREIRRDKSLAWAVLHPHDVWHNEWMMNDDLQPKPGA